MKSFKDSKGVSWDIEVNVGTVKTVKDLTDVELLDLHTKEVERVFNNPILFINVLYAVCKEQADSRNMTDRDFGRAMVGDCLEEATYALLQGVADFFPKSRRQVLESMQNKMQEATAKLTADALKKIESLDVNTLPTSMKSPGSSD